MTPERLAEIRALYPDPLVRALVDHINAVTEKLEGTRSWLSRVEGELKEAMQREAYHHDVVQTWERSYQSIKADLDAATKDTSRLDWLQNDQGRHVYPSAHFEGRPWACGERAYVEIRSAIDDAMSWPVPQPRA